MRAYALITILSVAITWLAIACWGQPVLGLALATLFAAGSVASLERLHPFSQAWRHGSKRAFGRDLALALVAGVITQLLLSLTVVLVARLDTGLRWPLEGAPILLQAFLYLLIVDGLAYLSHRALHRVRWLWRWHATHHRAEELYWLNTFRLHPLDALVSALFNLTWAAALALPEEVVALATSWLTAHLFLQHANLSLRTASLSPWLATSEFHRWHHAPDAPTSNHNYGHLFGFWDVLFGTYRRGEVDPSFRVGIEPEEE